MNQQPDHTFIALPDDILASLPEFFRHYFQRLEKIIQEQAQEIRELKSQLAKNSSNSSKPPGSDGFKKPSKTKSQRGETDKKPGGQDGRVGKTLKQIEIPDQIFVHSPEICQKCCVDLSQVIGECTDEKRQVFEIPKPKVEVVEHRIEKKICPCCGEISKGSFPENIKAPVQYGEHVQALATYFKNQHLIPAERVCEIFEEVFGIPISPGTCSKIDKRLFNKLEIFETNLKAHLLAAKVLHFDETGMRCQKKLHWIHVASSETATFYGIHTKRGQEAIDEFDILPKFLGTACHDHWFPYFAYTQVKHGLCNAHHLRELTFIHEQEEEEWAGEMKKFLLKAKKQVEVSLSMGYLPKDEEQALTQEYAKIVLKGLEYHMGLTPLPKGKKGKQKQRAGKNLLNRLSDKQECVLLFIRDLSVPFTNNLAERDVRMSKVKQKVSGCFRTLEGGITYCRIRSYISTAKKQGWEILEAIADAIRGAPKEPSMQPI